MVNRVGRAKIPNLTLSFRQKAGHLNEKTEPPAYHAVTLTLPNILTQPDHCECFGPFLLNLELKNLAILGDTLFSNPCLCHGAILKTKYVLLCLSRGAM